MLYSKKGDMNEKNEKNAFQAQRLLYTIENTKMTAKCRQNLCELIKKYFYENYENIPSDRKNILMNQFMYDLIWYTQIDCINSEDYDISNLKEDIILTFAAILYRKDDLRVSCWEKLRSMLIN